MRKSQYLPLSGSEFRNFNGAALFQVRKLGFPTGFFPLGFPLQWGRTFSSAEMFGFCYGCRCYGNTSMGPHFFKCGNVAGFEIITRIIRTSMGPHFFKCGNSADFCSFSNIPSDFNGAALFQVRKLPEPPPEKTAKTALQWGRTFSSAEIQLANSLRHPLSCTSMGPHFFKCGNNNTTVLYGDGTWTSMGPHFFKCGNGRVGVRLKTIDTNFNGAALFQVRKWQTASHALC